MIDYDLENNDIDSEEFIPSVQYKGKKWLVCTNQGVVCLLNQKIENWVTPLNYEQLFHVRSFTVVNYAQIYK
jgi:hypothetical protein